MLRTILFALLFCCSLATAQTDAAHANEAMLIEHARRTARYENDGTSTIVHSFRYLVQTEAGVQALGIIPIGYNKGTDELTVEYVRVRKPDGSTVEVPLANVQEQPLAASAEAPVYTDLRQKHIPITALRPGDRLEIQYTSRTHTPLVPGHFYDEIDFVDDVIVLKEEIVLDLPATRAVKIKTTVAQPAAVREENGRRVHTFTGSNLTRKQKTQAEELEEMRRNLEDARAGITKPAPAPAIRFTTFESWQQVGDWYAALQTPQAQPSPEVRAKAEELIRGLATDAEKVKAIYNYVSSEFRYISISFGLGRLQPHTAGEVFKNHFGDCKDKHTLLQTMLGVAGIQAWPVLIHSGRDVDQDVPAPLQFDHLITAVQVGSEVQWLDSTPSVAPFRALFATLRGKQALLVQAGGKSRFATTPSDLPYGQSVLLTTTGKVNDAGRVEARMEHTFRSDLELELRAAFRATPQPQWKELLQNLSYMWGFAGEVTDANVFNLADTEQPLRITYSYARDEYVTWNEGRGAMRLSMPPFYLPQREEKDKTPRPIRLGSPSEGTQRARLDFPATATAKAPLPISLVRDYAEYQSSYRIEGQTLIAERKLKIKMREIPAEREADYKAFLRAVGQDDQQQLALVRRADAPALPLSAQVDPIHQQALFAVKNRDFRSAQQLFEKVLKLDPKHKTAWGEAGALYLDMGDLEKGEAALRKQVEINPFDPYAYNELGRAMVMESRFAEAQAFFSKQLELNPLDSYALRQLGRSLLEMNKAAEGLPYLEKAAQISPEDAQGQLDLGRAYLRTGKTQEALAAFRTAGERADDSFIRVRAARILLHEKMELETAQSLAENAAKEISAELAELTLDRFGMEHIYSLNRLTFAWNILGAVHLARGNFEQALPYLRAAWVNTNAGEAGMKLGELYEKMGKKQLAIDAYMMAAAAVPPAKGAMERYRALAGPSVSRARSWESPGVQKLQAMRTFKLPLRFKTNISAEFNILLTPDGVEDVRLVSGDQRLGRAATMISGLKLGAEFPDATPVKLVRRALVSCSQYSGECMMVLITPDAFIRPE